MSTCFDSQLDAPVNLDVPEEDDSAEAAYADYLDAFESRSSGESPVSFAEFCSRATTVISAPVQGFDVDDDIPY